jgi:hypothetical protein
VDMFEDFWRLFPIKADALREIDKIRRCLLIFQAFLTIRKVYYL